MLTMDDREEIKRLVAEVVEGLQRSTAVEEKHIAENEWQQYDSLVEITARAIEVFGTREKAIPLAQNSCPGAGRPDADVPSEQS